MIRAALAQSIDRKCAFLALFVILAALAVLYADTIASIVHIWRGNQSYMHGFIIVPICAFLVWKNRTSLTDIQISQSITGLAILAGLSMLWWFGDTVGIQVIKQFSVVAMIPAVALAILGAQFTNDIRFALGYLVFAVPFGEFLTPYLIDFTASFSVDALNALGIPVLRDGRYFHVPTGSFEIAKACSGLKFLVATLALATLYTHFLFNKVYKAILFVGFAVVLSIFANAIRATMIVLLLHYTDLDIAAGQDHEFIGWIIYGLIVFVLVWVGARFQDESTETNLPNQTHDSGNRQIADWSIATLVGMSVAALATVALGPTLNVFSNQLASPSVKLTAGLPDELEGWIAQVPPNNQWRPVFAGYSQMSLGRYTRFSQNVDVALVRYLSLRQGSEITNATNSVIDQKEWVLGNVRQLPIEIDGSISFTIEEVVVTQPRESRLIWYWLQVDGVHVSGAVQTKFNQIRNRLAGNTGISSAIIISTRVETTESAGRLMLNRFLSLYYSRFQDCVDSDSANQGCSLGAPGLEEN